MKNYKKKSSFTLIELLVVIVIIGVIAGLITLGVSSFVTTSQNTKMVAQLSSLGTALETYGTYYQGNLCLEDKANNSNFLSYYGIQTVPSNPNYDGLTAGNQTTTGTNNCLLYFSDGENYSIRTPAPGNKGYLIQESRYMKTQDIQTSCESGWIPFGNRCIMKYEAKCSEYEAGGSCVEGTSTLVSQALGTPWVNLTQDQAKAECQKIGAHLITNAEWMALARDIEDTDSNWSGGIIARGWSASTSYGDSWTNSGPAPTTGSSCLYNSSSGCASSGSHLYKRTLTLSNGEVIWDLSGNVWEWVDETIQTAELTSNFPSQSSNWYEYNGTTTLVPRTASFSATTSSYILPYSEAGPKGRTTTDNASKGLGRIYIDSNNAYCSSTGTDCSPTHAFLRGGGWGNTSYAGVFALRLDVSPEGRSDNIGFRCAR